MTSTLRWFSFAASVLIVWLLTGDLKAQSDEWVSLFDGKSMDGWEKVGNEKSVWEVKDGALCGTGPASMLVCTHGPYKNFRYRAEIRINDKGNSGDEGGCFFYHGAYRGELGTDDFGIGDHRAQPMKKMNQLRTSNAREIIFVPT